MRSFSQLGSLIFFDRYSRKTQDRMGLRAGQRVVVCLNIDTAQREMAAISADEGGDTVTVSLGASTVVEVPRDHIDVPVETIGDGKARIAKAVASVEATPELQAEWEQTYLSLLRPGEELPAYVPAGRIWAGAGVEHLLTPYNCFVLNPPKDTRKGIVATLDEMLEIMSRGGGVGIPIMSLRPQFALVRGVNGRSSGATRWSQLYSFGTGLIEQGGSRRGALMLIQYVWHPDVLSFITAKETPGVLENANVSVAVTDAFMEAVRDDKPWDLIFPKTDTPNFNELWDGDIDAWRAAGLPVDVYKTLPARELWLMIAKSAWKSAEPGLLFIDRVRANSNSWYYSEGRIFCTNPCGEEPIPGNAVCNLGHVNLALFATHSGIGAEAAEVDWLRLRLAVRAAVRFQDAIIDLAYNPFPANADQQLLERRVGIGTMGLAELLIRCHVRYGNNAECLAFIDKVFGFIATEAYLAGADLAAEKGSFPAFDCEKFLQSGFMRAMPESVRDAVRAKGMRNVTLLTQAPTGTVGTMVGTSTGIEPFYQWQWTRKGRLGSHDEAAAVVEEYLTAFPAARAERSAAIQATVDAVPEMASAEDTAKAREDARAAFMARSSAGLPEWYVHANSLTPEDHAYTQTAIQRWVDAAISKTANMPKDHTVEQVGRYYELLHSLGAKGGTIYRDGSRATQVLTTASSEATAPAAPAAVEPPCLDLHPVPTEGYDCPTWPIQSPLGKLSVKIGVRPESGQPFEMWLDVSKGGTTVSADTEALARIVSVFLRIPSPMEPMRRLEIVAQQLQGIGGGDPSGFGERRVLSLPDSIAKALRHMEPRLRRGLGPHGPALPAPVAARPQAPEVDICPSCHAASLMHTEGCVKCLSCPYSRC